MAKPYPFGAGNGGGAKAIHDEEGAPQRVWPPIAVGASMAC